MNMRIETYDEIIGISTFFYSSRGCRKDVIDYFRDKYCIDISNQITEPDDGNGCYYYYIRASSWEDTFKLLVIYLIESEKYQAIFSFCEISDKCLHTLSHLDNQENVLISLQQFQKIILKKNEQLNQIKNLLLDIAVILNITLPLENLPLLDNQSAYGKIVEQNKAILKFSTNIYNIIILTAREKCLIYNELAAKKSSLSNAAEKILCFVPDKKFEDQSCYIFYGDGEIDKLNVLMSEIKKLINNIDELKPQVENFEISEEQKLIHKFSSYPSPLVWIIYDKELSRDWKLTLIEKLALKTPLNSNIVNISIDSGEPEYPSLHKKSPLLHAVKVRDREILELLIDKGADINFLGFEYHHESGRLHDYKVSALHLAVEYNFLEIVQVLLKNGSKIDQKDSLGFTPLHRAHTAECIKTLLQYGANPNACDDYGDTPLHILCRKQIKKPLCDTAKDNSAHNDEMQQVQFAIMALIIGGASVNSPNKLGYTPLHCALLSRNEYNIDFEFIKTKVTLLCENGADVNAVTRNSGALKESYDVYEKHPTPGMSPLLCLYDQRNASSFTEGDSNISVTRLNIAHLLVMYGATLTFIDEQGYTILHKLVAAYEVTALEYFLTFPQVKELINYQLDNHSPTALHIAARMYARGSYKAGLTIIKTLLENDANPLAIFIFHENSYFSKAKYISVTPFEYALKNTGFSKSPSPDCEELVCIRLHEIKIYTKKFQEAVVEFNEIQQQISKHNISGAESEKLTMAINSRLSQLVEVLEELRRKVPGASEELAKVKLYIAAHLVQQMESLDSVPNIIVLIREIRSLLPESQASEKLIEKVVSVIYELGNQCCNLLENLTGQIKDTPIAAAIACWLYANEFDEKIDYKSFFLSLMGLKMNSYGLSMKELKSNYPQQYADAWRKINEQRIKCFYDGDTFSGKNFLRKPFTKNISIIQKNGLNYVFWHKPLPTTEILKSQDDCQRIKRYTPESQLIRRSSIK